MEIGPVIGVRNMLAIKPRSPDLEPPAIFEVESSSRTGDETYSSSREKPGSRRDADEADDDSSVLNDEKAGTGMLATDQANRSQISFFA
jgi:hypothetical protein